MYVTYLRETEIQGKWHHVHYKILEKLGVGANRVVYLVQLVNGTLAALKNKLFQHVRYSRSECIKKALKSKTKC